MRITAFFVAIGLSVGSLITPNDLTAFEYSTDLGGGGYQEVRAAPHLAPAVALAAVVLAAMIAVSLQTQNDTTHIHF